MVSTNSAQYQIAISWLVNQRHLRGVTQSELSEKLGKHQSFVSKYENGERRLDVAEVVEICGVLGVDPHGIIDALT